MAQEKWLVQPGQTRIIDLEGIRWLKAGLIGGQIDVIAHDDPGVRVEIHAVTAKDLRIEADGDALEIDHPQLRWDNFVEAFRHFGPGGPRAEISVAVPRELALTLGVVSASALVAGLRGEARLNSVSGDLIVDGHQGRLSVNAVSGDVQLRGLDGALSVNSVSGAVAATGRLSRAAIDTVPGAMILDAHGPVDEIGLHTVSGAATIQLDAGLAASFDVHTVGGRVVVDGVQRSSSAPTHFVGSSGELAGSFAEVRARSVSGAVTVLRGEPGRSGGGIGGAEAGNGAEAPADSTSAERSD